MPSAQDIQNQQELLTIHRNNLAIHVKQQALYGSAATPAEIQARIGEARANIQRIKTVLRSWNVEVADLPDDEAPSP